MRVLLANSIFVVFALVLSLAEVNGTRCETQSSAHSDGKLLSHIIIDAGSTGSRIHILKFLSNSSHSTGLQLLDTTSKSTKPGLSAFRSFQQVKDSLTPLINFALKNIRNESEQQNTGIAIMATAGLRLLNQLRRKDIILWATEVLRQTPFKAKIAEPVRVINGSEEALFSWMTINSLLDSFDLDNNNTVGMLEMGGGSTQICFSHSHLPKNESHIFFSTLGGKEYNLHCESYLNLGAMATKLSMLGFTNSSMIYSTPCVHPEFNDTLYFGANKANIIGLSSGRPAEPWKICLNDARQKIEELNVSRFPLLMPTMSFVAISSFYYQAIGLAPSNNDIVMLKVKDFLNAAKIHCANPKLKGKYLPYKCMDLAIVYGVFKHFGFQDNSNITTTEKISNHTTSWTLGAAIHYLTEENGSQITLTIPKIIKTNRLRTFAISCRTKGETQPFIKWYINDKRFHFYNDVQRTEGGRYSYRYKSTIIIDTTKDSFDRINNIVTCRAIFNNTLVQKNSTSNNERKKSYCLETTSILILPPPEIKLETGKEELTIYVGKTYSIECFSNDSTAVMHFLWNGKPLNSDDEFKFEISKANQKSGFYFVATLTLHAKSNTNLWKSVNTKSELKCVSIGSKGKFVRTSQLILRKKIHRNEQGQSNLFQCKKFKLDEEDKCEKIHRRCVRSWNIFTAYSPTHCCCMKVENEDI